MIHDDEGATEPDQRRGLTYALQMLLDGDADTIIVPTGEMLSCPTRRPESAAP
ncbi:hypothetical protein KV557_37460 [Kitasatospora aureofaciens]|uniref:hypothetical protein n=1 Tax=Kitasatospora aureofaciens TaxID=1894 RepID=UPI001C4391B5|nr:hypothetical protein [Kitasatospora aureofaciens]MBV6702724.1 hypothetical protein [Kitasatospora aureofaciens]